MALNPIGLAYRIAHWLRKIWWRVAQPHIYGAKAVVLDGRGHVLLIRHSYGDRLLFMMPGGGIGKGEDPTEAIAREVREETGCTLSDIRLHGRFLDRKDGAHNHIHIFVGTTSDEPVIDGREIVEARFVPLDALPDTIARASRERIIEVRDGLPPAAEW